MLRPLHVLGQGCAEVAELLMTVPTPLVGFAAVVVLKQTTAAFSLAPPSAASPISNAVLSALLLLVEKSAAGHSAVHAPGLSIEEFSSLQLVIALHLGVICITWRCD